MTTTTITAALVQALRARTGAGLMDCKRALQSVEGDLDAAVEVMRQSGQVQAEKKSARITSEGLILIKNKTVGNSSRALILEVNCETDFVSRDENFKQFADHVAQLAVDNSIESVEALLSAVFPDTDQTVETIREALVAKLGENIQIRRLALVCSQSNTVIGSYVHGGRMGAIVQLKGGDEPLAKDLAMNVIAHNPLVISPEDIPCHLLTEKREAITAQAQTSGKPEEVVNKMVEGRLSKFCDEVSLLGQVAVKDPTISVRQLLEKSGAEVISFIRFVVAEGIEKPTENFAEAVRAQIKES